VSDAKTITADEARSLLDGTMPGPWRSSRIYDDNSGWIYLVASDRYEVARVIDGQGSEEIHDTDLIAAAPDLAATVAALHEEIARLRVEVSVWRSLPDANQTQHALDVANVTIANLRTVIDARDVAPTDAEIEAHEAASGGYWLVASGTVHAAGPTRFPWLVRLCVETDGRIFAKIDSADEWVPRDAVIARMSAGWWIALRGGLPCTWPVVP